PTYLSSFGTYGTGKGQMNKPGDVAVDAGGNLWVADKGNNRIVKYSPSGGELLTFGTYGSAGGQLNRPTALAIDPKGNIWVADSNNNRIQEFAPEGEQVKFLKAVGTHGAGNGEFSGPEGI